MEYKIQDIQATFHGEILKNLGDFEYVIKINDTQHNLRILSMDARGIEFILNQQYHKVKYLTSSTAEMKILIDGLYVTLNMHSSMDDIVYKNSGSDGRTTQIVLKSQIPGKVVSIAVEENSSVKKGDLICTLESMKMQVDIKAHKDGTISSIKIKEGSIVAKNDPVAEIE